jgi:flagellar hook protein FlgE
MSINTAASGLNAAQTGLDTVSNDLANASTTGFKNQSALFSAIYAANQPDLPGIGVQSAGIDTNFSQGNPVATGNSLDAAIQGDGFFVVNNDGQQQYTRDGAFQLSTSGVLTNSSGATVLGYATNSTTGAPTGGLAPITVSTGALAASPSTQIGLTVNLNSSDAETTAGAAANASPATATLDATSSDNYNESTSVVAYDAQGNANTVNLYFQNVGPASVGGVDQWNVYAEPVSSTGSAVGVTTTALPLLTTLSFNADGTLAGASPNISATSTATGADNTAPLTVTWPSGANTTPAAAPTSTTINLNLTGTTLGAQSFSIGGTTNDGYAPGSYTGASIDSTGQVQATYSNGQKLTVGTVGLANFVNDEGLEPISGNLYAETTTSGQPVVNVPGAGQAGTLLSGNLEQSNVSTSTSLVDLIQYQQAYEANATEIQTEQTDFTRLSQI